jgi:hypothetical protein
MPPPFERPLRILALPLIEFDLMAITLPGSYRSPPERSDSTAAKAITS